MNQVKVLATATLILTVIHQIAYAETQRAFGDHKTVVGVLKETPGCISMTNNLTACITGNDGWKCHLLDQRIKSAPWRCIESMSSTADAKKAR